MLSPHHANRKTPGNACERAASIGGELHRRLSLCVYACLRQVRAGEADGPAPARSNLDAPASPCPCSRTGVHGAFVTQFRCRMKGHGFSRGPRRRQQRIGAGVHPSRRLALAKTEVERAGAETAPARSSLKRRSFPVFGFSGVVELGAWQRQKTLSGTRFFSMAPRREIAIPINAKLKAGIGLSRPRESDPLLAAR
jgi:hypothetical protein